MLVSVWLGCVMNMIGLMYNVLVCSSGLMDVEFEWLMMILSLLCVSCGINWFIVFLVSCICVCGMCFSSCDIVNGIVLVVVMFDVLIVMRLLLFLCNVVMLLCVMLSCVLMWCVCLISVLL